LTNPLTNDGILTRQSPADREVGPKGRQDARTEQGGIDKPAAETQLTTDVDRAQQRLAQEAARGSASTISSTEQARSVMAELRQQLSDDPAAALRAIGQVTDSFYEAAAARPTA